MKKRHLLALLFGICLVMTTTSATCTINGEEDHRGDKIQEDINPEPEKNP